MTKETEYVKGEAFTSALDLFEWLQVGYAYFYMNSSHVYKKDDEQYLETDLSDFYSYFKAIPKPEKKKLYAYRICEGNEIRFFDIDGGMEKTKTKRTPEYDITYGGDE